MKHLYLGPADSGHRTSAFQKMIKSGSGLSDWLATALQSFNLLMHIFYLSLDNIGQVTGVLGLKITKSQ